MANEYVFTNNAETELASAMGGADVVFTVTSGGGSQFPSIVALDNKRFIVLIEQGAIHEYMTVTVRSGDVFSGITRGGVNSFAAGASVKLVLTAENLESFLQKGYFRTVTSNPDGVLAAEYDGEEVYDTVALQWYKHCNSTLWKQMTS